MNKLYIVLFTAFMGTVANAQVSGKHIGSTGVGGDLSIQDNNGKMIPIGAKDDTQGNPLFLENWVPGSVQLKNGIKFTDTALNYSLFEDRLYFKRDNQFYIVAGVISEFFLANENDANAQPYHFVNGYPATPNTSDNTFFQVLADGKKFQLLKWQHKKIRETYAYGGKSESEYVNQLGYFVFEKSTHSVVSVGNKENTNIIKSTLSVDESTWKAYLNNHSASAKTEKGMVDFISYLNGL